ncbi:MAG: hypothetical protein KAG45_03420, partial [Methyloprofundus sp.]|nr:hypothetical protein [Methyloprofundus sp.]
MVAYNQNSRPVPVFHAFPALEEGSTLAGYAALIAGHGLLVPAPDYLCAIGTKHKRYEKGRWRIFTPRHKPNDSLHNHLTFALKHEGIDLAVLKALFVTTKPEAIIDIVRSEPTGAYSRRLWFLYEWLCGNELDIEDATQGNFVAIINDTLQYPGPSHNSKRHRVRNNLPGTREFCPLIRRTERGVAIFA